MVRLFALLAVLVTVSSFSESDEKFPIRYITDVEGNQLDLHQSNKPFTYIHVWASWCRPCRKQNLELSRLLEDSLVRTKVEVITISFDSDSLTWRKALRNDQLSKVGALLEQDGFKGEVAEKLNIQGLPATYLLNDAGIVLSSDCSPLRIPSYL